MLICEDISNCDQTKNAAVSVCNKQNFGPKPFTYTDKMIFQCEFGPTTSDIQECCCSEFYDDQGVLKVEFGKVIRECQTPECNFRFLQNGLKKKLQVCFEQKSKIVCLYRFIINQRKKCGV